MFLYIYLPMYIILNQSTFNSIQDTWQLQWNILISSRQIIIWKSHKVMKEYKNNKKYVVIYLQV